MESEELNETGLEDVESIAVGLACGGNCFGLGCKG